MMNEEDLYLRFPIEFLQKYGGSPYKDIKKALPEERKKISEIKKSGEQLTKIVGELFDSCKKKFPFIQSKSYTWLTNNGSSVKHNFWIQFYYDKNFPICIAICPEEYEEETYRYRISIEIKDEKATEEDYKLFESLLNIEKNPQSNLCYIVITNGKIEKAEDQDINVIKNKFFSKEYHRVFIGNILEWSDTLSNKEINNFIFDTITDLIPFYSYVVDNIDEQKNAKQQVKQTQKIQEKQEIIKQELMKKFPLNQILYGPPGTGKTYHTVIKALSIIENKESAELMQEDYQELKKRFDILKKEHRIEFITFHQSYSYEDFIEGIKPYLPEWGNTSQELSYIGSDGILKTICNNAKVEFIKEDKRIDTDFTKRNFYKMSLGVIYGEETEDIYNYCIKNNVIAFGYGENLDFSKCSSLEDIKKVYQENNIQLTNDFDFKLRGMERFLLKLKEKDIILISNGVSSIKAIAEVTGGYTFSSNREISFSQFRQVNWLYKGENIPVAKFLNKQLSQQSIYAINDENINKNFFNELLSEKVRVSNGLNPYVLIIDEINRGDVSKIFGELITLLEEDKRLGNCHELTVTLPYSKEDFGVPKNLYIIGTMNTADRSIALLDTALRRRFDFEEMMPKPELLNATTIEGINLGKLLANINKRISSHYDRDHQIGHAYFMIAKEQNMQKENKEQFAVIHTQEQLEKIYHKKIFPLLNEYFYNELETVAKVLNCPKEVLLENDVIKIFKYAQQDKNIDMYDE